MSMPDLYDPSGHVRRVFLRDMVLTASIGIHPHEQIGPQRVCINISLIVEDETARKGEMVGPDEMARVVDYAAVAGRVRTLVRRATCVWRKPWRSASPRPACWTTGSFRQASVSRSWTYSLMPPPPGSKWCGAVANRLSTTSRTPDISDETTTAVPTGVAIIEAMLATLPSTPGVYRMLDAKGDALYVGKARSLERRVKAYTQIGRLPERLRRMVAETASMEIMTTHTEAEALLLEANLIKRLKPRFNIVLRDDKSYPWLMVTADHPFPQIAKHRGAQVRKGAYYGPFASAWAVNQTLTALQRVFLFAPAPTACSRTAPVPACCTRSSAAPRHASGECRPRSMAGWSIRRGPSCRMARPPCRRNSPPNERRSPNSRSSAPRRCGIASGA